VNAWDLNKKQIESPASLPVPQSDQATDLPTWAARIVDGIAWLGAPLCIISVDEVLLYANPAHFASTGRQPHELIGRHIRDISDADTYDIVHANIRRSTETKEPISFGRRWTAASGEIKWIELRYFPYLDANRNVLGFLVIGDEGHRLNSNESATIERERLLRQLANTAGSPILYVDRSLIVRFVNQPFLDWVGKTEDMVAGFSADDVFTPQASDFYRPLVVRALAGERIEIEAPSQARAGEVRHLKISIIPDRRSSGEITGVFISAIDIEQDHQLKEALLERERQLQLFTDNIPEAVAYLDTSRCYKFVNKAFLRQRGKKREEIIGKNSAEVLGIEAAKLATPFVERAFAGETVTYERQVSMPDGQLRWYQIRTVPDMHEAGPDKGKVKGIYVVGIDIHEVKLAHEALTHERAELRDAMDSLPYPMAAVDRDMRYQMINRTLEQQIGNKREELIGRDLHTIFSARRVAEVVPIWQRVLEGETISTERLMTFGDGTERWMIVKYTPRRNAAGEIHGLYTAAIDIDNLKRKELELRHANWLLNSHFENTPLAVVEWDEDMRVRKWSPQAEKIFGWSESDTLGKRIQDWHFVYEEDFGQVTSMAERLRTTNVPRATSLNRNYRSDGRVIWVEWYNSSLTDDTGKVVSVFSLAQDVTTRVLAEERLVHQATHDGLTGLPNRVMLQERMSQAISRSRRSGLRVAALFIDLDRFKDVNDTLGHRIGDELLREMAKRLQAAVRESDLLVRLSGDEFMVVLEQITDLDAPRIVANKLLAELSTPAQIGGHDIHIAGSIGISVFPDDAEDAEALLKNADMAMYRAKEAGKNTYQSFTRDMAEHGSNMRILENALRNAIKRDELRLYYQAKVDLHTDRIIGAEALLRWQHPSRGIILPGEFVHLAEETGLVHDIGHWVLDAAISQLQAWQLEANSDDLGDFTLAINLAAGQFRASQLAERIRDRITAYNILPKNLEVELTESGLIRDPDGVGRTLQALREMGISIAIDDFGTGYSSLSHLKRFAIDTLKIDKSFIADLLHDPDDRAIVSALIALGHALEIEVVAEGVETTEQRDMLARMGCHAYQGYLFAKPLTAENFTALWRNNIAMHSGNNGIKH
jgi:diguanylate cyclase (GGDEF)-like protein/PAS domain S-box-containing protein